MRFAITVGHAGKAVPEPGSGTDVDGDGRIGAEEQERSLCLRYAAAAHERLLALGHDVLVLSDGSYSARDARVDAWGPDAHVHAHLDSRPRARGKVFHDPRSPGPRGPAAARAVCAALDRLVPEAAPAQALPATDAQTPGGARLVALDGSDPWVALVYEPLRTEDVARWRASGELRRIDDVGFALAEGLHAWSRGA